jgi:hypothetical protein
MDYRGVLLAVAVLGSGVVSLTTSCSAPDPGEVTFMERQKGVSSGDTTPAPAPPPSTTDGGGSTSSTTGGPVTAFSGAPAYVATDPATGGNNTTAGHPNGDPKFLSCQDCHKANSGLNPPPPPWAAAGTVYSDGTAGAAVAQAEVRMVDSTGKELAKVYTDTNGNFWVASIPNGIPAGAKVGVRNGTITKEMGTALSGVGDGACNKAGCHGSGGVGHIYLK